jgi:predicted CxxxxCH...CXXCH cytochrome family protein
MSHLRITVVSALAVLASAGCDPTGHSVARPIAETSGAALECTSCHGDAARAADDALVKAAPATGAHLAHLQGATYRDPIACATCHPVSASMKHADGRVDLPFAGSPAAGRSSFDDESGTCTTYCHGSAAPQWSGGALDCGSCHGNPPPSHASTSTACASCHPGTVLAGGALNLAAKLHLNGAVDVDFAHGAGWASRTEHGYSANASLASCRACHGQDLTGGTSGISCNGCHGGTAWQTNCTFCHGDATRVANEAAPPVGTQGETATTATAVGAHAKHLSGGAVGPAVACGECHSIPADLSHVNGTAAVELGAAASRGGLAPAWDGSGCASTYCHGATVRGGTNKAPVWTGGSSQAACGTCHGAPPSGHATAACDGCHPGYTATSVNLATHLDGDVDAVANHPAGFAAAAQHGYEANRTGLAGCKSCHGADLAGGAVGVSCTSCHASAGYAAWATTCTFCHGDPATSRSSPPVDTAGGSARSNVSVGAHAKHVSSTRMADLSCAECHPARTTSVVTDAAHLDGNGIAEVTLGARARTGGAAATYTRTSATSATCASTYCHGRFSGGANSGQGATPSWTSTTVLGCTSCHGNPPSTGEHSKHVGGEGIACYVCHNSVLTSANAFADRTLHVNGVDDVKFGGVWSGESGTIAGTWNASTRTCSSLSCHGSEGW